MLLTGLLQEASQGVMNVLTSSIEAHHDVVNAGTGQESFKNPSEPFLSFHSGDFLTEFLKLSCRKEATEEILGRGLAEEETKGYTTTTLESKAVCR